MDPHQEIPYKTVKNSGEEVPLLANQLYQFCKQYATPEHINKRLVLVHKDLPRYIRDLLTIGVRVSYANDVLVHITVGDLLIFLDDFDHRFFNPKKELDAKIAQSNSLIYFNSLFEGGLTH